MEYLLPLVILFNCLMIQGVLEWTVVGKVTEYGQNVTLFCNVPNCCPNDAGWDRWTPHQRTLFIDVKTGRPNKKYDGKVLKDGYTLIIQNFTEKDLNVSYSCLYGVTLGERKFLLEEDVFTSITQPGKSKLSSGEIGAMITGITMVIALLSIFIYFRIIRGKKQGIGKGRNTQRESEDVHDETEELLTKKSDKKESIQMNIKGRFTNISDRWPGSAHDSHVFRTSAIGQHLENGYQGIGQGVLLGDSGYPCRQFFADTIQTTSCW